MRNFLLLVGLVLCMNSWGQNVPLVSECNSWYHTMRYTGWNGGPWSNNHHTYFFNGDTLVDGVEYKKLYRDVRDTIFSNPINVNHALHLERLMRQDEDSVFFRFPMGDAEHLYAVFGLEVGDTLNYYPHTNFFPQVNLVVLAQDSVQIGNEYLTRSSLSNGFEFIEGVGASLGILKDFSIGIEGGIYLDCFIRNGQNLGVSWLGDGGAVYDCNATIHGCMDVNACNFNQWAEVDLGYCTYGDCPQSYDVNGDGTVSTEDLLSVIGDLGCVGAGCNADFNADGIVNIQDVLLLMGQFGVSFC